MYIIPQQKPPEETVRQIRHLTPAEREALCAEYYELRKDGGSTPKGWVAEKAAELGVSDPTVHKALAPAVQRLNDEARERGAARAAAPRMDQIKPRRVAGSYGGG